MGPHCSRGNLAWGCKSAEIFEQAALLASDRIIKEQEPMGRHKLGGPDCVGRVGRPKDMEEGAFNIRAHLLTGT